MTMIAFPRAECAENGLYERMEHSCLHSEKPCKPFFDDIHHAFTIDSNLVGWDILLATMIKATADIKEDGRRVNSKISHLIFFTSSRIRMVWFHLIIKSRH